MIKPMSESEASEYIPQWGRYMSDSDPGAIAYSAIPPECREHRDAMVAWLRDECLPIANGWHPDDPDDAEQLERAIAYLNNLELENFNGQ